MQLYSLVGERIGIRENSSRALFICRSLGRFGPARVQLGWADVFTPFLRSRKPKNDGLALSCADQSGALRLAISDLALWLDLDLGLDRIGNETLIVSGVIHLLDLLLGRLFVPGEFESLL